MPACADVGQARLERLEEAPRERAVDGDIAAGLRAVGTPGRTRTSSRAAISCSSSAWRATGAIDALARRPSGLDRRLAAADGDVGHRPRDALLELRRRSRSPSRPHVARQRHQRAGPTCPIARATSRQISVGSVSEQRRSPPGVPSSVRSSASASAQPWRRNALLLAQPLDQRRARRAVPNFTHLPSTRTASARLIFLTAAITGAAARRRPAPRRTARAAAATRWGLSSSIASSSLGRRRLGHARRSASPSIEPETVATSSLLIGAVAAVLRQLDAERARLLGDRLGVVVGGVGIDVERGRVAAELLEPGIEPHDQVAARPGEPLGDRDLRELGAHPQSPRDRALEHVAAQLAPAWQREAARAHQVVLARRPREPARHRERAPELLGGLELGELVVAELAGLRVLGAEQVVVGARDEGARAVRTTARGNPRRRPATRSSAGDRRRRAGCTRRCRRAARSAGRAGRHAACDHDHVEHERASPACPAPGDRARARCRA